MKCSSLVSARCAVLLTAVLVLGGACSDDQAEDVSADRGADRGANSAPAASPAVAIENFLYKPDNLTVKVGAEVPVTNGDDAAHTLTASDGSFDTGTIEPGGKATVKVPAGDHPYICSIHPYMKGVLRADA